MCLHAYLAMCRQSSVTEEEQVTQDSGRCGVIVSAPWVSAFHLSQSHFYGWRICRISGRCIHCPSTIDAHFCLLLVLDRLKSQMTYCSNPHQVLGLMKIQFWWSHVPVFYDAADKPFFVFPPNSNLRSVQNTDVLTSASGLKGRLVLAEVSSHVQCMVKAHHAL